MEPPPTLEELVKEVGISVDLLEQRCSDEHLNSISLFLDWRTVAPHLGLSVTDIEDIKSEERTEQERRIKALQKWKSKYTFKATLKSLVVVLLTVGKADNAENICRLLKSQAPKATPTVARAAAFPDNQQQIDPVMATEHTERVQLRSITEEGSQLPLQPVEYSIEREIEDLEDQFLDVVDKAAESLENVPLQRIKRCITQLRVSVKYQHIRFLAGNLSAINSAQSVQAIFSILGLYWNFLNCGLLKELISKLAADDTKRLMEMYTEKLRAFRRKTKLGDFIDKWAQTTPPHFTEFRTHMGEDWRDSTLEHLDDFRIKLARSMCVEEYAVQMKSIEPGSVSVTWVLQSSLPAIAYSLESAFQQLKQKCHVLQVFFRGKCLKFQELPPSAASPGHVPPRPLTPVERSQQETKHHFDIIDALLGAGVPHIAEHILSSLDAKSLAVSEQVSTLWRDVIEDLPIWKHLVKENVKNKPIWKELFERRGWYKYLDVPLTKQMSGHYHQLYHTAFKDIHFLESNWSNGHYALTKIETDSPVTCLQYDDNKIVTGHGGPDYTIKIWDRSTLQVSEVLKGHKGIVYCLQYNEVIISGSDDHTVKVWDIQMGLMINNLLYHKGAVESLKFKTAVLITGSLDGTVAVWDMKCPTDITLRTVLYHEYGGVWAVDLSETYIISAGSRGGIIKVWASFTGGLVRTLHGHSNIVRSLQLQGSYLISGSHDKTIRIWNVDTGECLRVLQGHDDYVLCVAMDDKRILSGSEDQTIKVWDLAAVLELGSSSADLCLTSLREHTGWVQGLQFDSFQIISCSSDKTIILHNLLDLVPSIFRT